MAIRQKPEDGRWSIKAAAEVQTKEEIEQMGKKDQGLNVIKHFEEKSGKKFIPNKYRMLSSVT